MTTDIALRQRIEARLDRHATVIQLRKPFDASVRQAEIFVGKYWITTRTAAGVEKYAAIGNPGALADAAYAAGAMGVTVMVRP